MFTMLDLGLRSDKLKIALRTEIKYYYFSYGTVIAPPRETQIRAMDDVFGPVRGPKIWSVIGPVRSFVVPN